MVLDGGEVDICTGPVAQRHGCFFPGFLFGVFEFGLGRKHYPRRGIMFSSLFSHSVGMFITCGGHVESYLR